MEESKIKVVMCEPSMVAKVIEIDNELETFQRIVGGCIEEYMLFVDDVAIVCNGEGKMNGVELNRAIYADFEKGENSYDTN